jgi:hypothetical protein
VAAAAEVRRDPATSLLVRAGGHAVLHLRLLPRSRHRCSARGDIVTTSDDHYRSYFEVSYDVDNGEMLSTHKMLNDTVTDIIRVRANLQEKVLRQACIYELEKLGYTIFAPDNGEAP